MLIKYLFYQLIWRLMQKGFRRVWRYQRGNQKSYIEEEQTTQWPKEKVQKDKQRSTKHTYKTKDRVTRTPLKTGGERRCSGRVSSSCPTDFSYEELNDTKWVVRIHKSMKDIQYNGQKKNDNRTNNDLQNTTLQIEQYEQHWDEIMYPGRVGRILATQVALIVFLKVSSISFWELPKGFNCITNCLGNHQWR